MPKDLELVCGKLEELIQESERLLEKSTEERNATPSRSLPLGHWLALVGA